ncbi:unnamed protein product, partial [Mesorhabditis belari]|uniref:RNA helicase n=1 Tax=Mesorhabditis belari TaxID=2138241 RepID=A0AAF3FG25_9BILA
MGGDGFGARTSDNANASVRTGFGWQRQAVGGRSVGFGNIGGFSARSNATASNTGFGSQRHGTGQKQSNDKTRLVVDDEKSNDDMCDLPANSKVAFIPRRLTKSELYQLRITAGKRSEEMYTMKVQITTEGPPLGLKAIESFADMELVPDLRRFVEESGYTTPFPIQRWVIPIVKAKLWIVSKFCVFGKTAAYLLPILQNLLAENDLAEPGIYAYPRCLIFAPTRELTEQIYNEGRKFLEEKSPIMGAVYGGIEMVHARKELSKGPSIIVGTMGRLTHYIEQGSIILSHLRYAVIDEVDRMLNTDDFAEKIRYILSNGPPKQQRTTLMFSATFPDIIQLIAHEHLRPDSVMISIDKIGSANKCIKQEFIEISDPAKKKDLLLQLLKVDVKNYELQDGDIRKLKTLVFVNRKTFADHLGLLLSEAGLPAATIHGDRDQTQRDKALGEFKDGKKPVLIATAVAERGLDIVGVDHVINYDLPRTIEEYVHRIGRTGRVGNPGVATSFFDTNEKGDHRIAAALVSTLIDAGQEIPAFLTQLIDGIEMDVESQPRVVPKLKPIEEEEDW